MPIFNSCPVFSSHDDYMTRKETWEQIKDYLPQDKVIWESFYGNGKSGEYLQELGFEVIHRDVDFFTHDLGDIIVSNPPYTIKKEVFTRLKQLGKPFVMLVPSTTVQTKYFKELFADEHIQLIIPWKKNHFDKLVNGEIQKGKDNCSFYTLYITWKLNLDKDVIFI